MKKSILFGFVLLVLASCNSITRNWGGDTKIELGPNERCVNVTWKKSDLWVLVQDTTKPKTFIFREYSNFGILEGEVIIVEK